MSEEEYQAEYQNLLAMRRDCMNTKNCTLPSCDSCLCYSEKDRIFEIRFIVQKTTDMILLKKSFFHNAWMNNDFIDIDLKQALYDLNIMKIPSSIEQRGIFTISGKLNLREAHQKAIILRDLQYLLLANKLNHSKEEIEIKYPIIYRIEEKN